MAIEKGKSIEANDITKALNTKVNTSDVLSLEDIQDTSDLTGKVASASSVKNLIVDYDLGLLGISHEKKFTIPNQDSRFLSLYLIHEGYSYIYPEVGGTLGFNYTIDKNELIVNRTDDGAYFDWNVHVLMLNI